MDEILRSDDNSQIHALIETFGNENAHTRHIARQQLVELGPEVIPALITALGSLNWHVRWESAKTLGEIGSPDGATALVTLLKDEDTGVRWAAMGSLIRLGRACVEPLLKSLTHEAHSARVREGAHHVLHELKNRQQLTEPEERVFRALEGRSPAIEVPWAASEALKKEGMD